MASALAAVLAFSGGSGADPPIPKGYPGVVPFIFNATAVGDGEAKAAIRRDRRWLARSKPLGAVAPGWARRMHARSLLALRAVANKRTGAAVAGAREGWAYVWPRDAAAVAIALASAGYRPEARGIVRFLGGLDLGAAARFDGMTGRPVDGRDAQGDAVGWVAAAARAVGFRARAAFVGWRDQADYQEKESGDFLGNAIASGVDSEVIRKAFGSRRGLSRRPDSPDSGLDSVAAWAVRPFPRPALFPLVRRTLLRLEARSGRFGLVPAEGWDGGEDPWTAPTAWTAWSLAALARSDCRNTEPTASRERSAAFTAAAGPHRSTGLTATARRGRSAASTAAYRDREAAVRLLADLRRAATPLGMFPERVDVDTGAPTSTTPLAWSHAFAILALRELWPGTSARLNHPYGAVNCTHVDLADGLQIRSRRARRALPRPAWRPGRSPGQIPSFPRR